MIKQFFLSLFILTTAVAFSQADTVIYFNATWERANNAIDATYSCDCSYFKGAMHGTTRCYHISNGNLVKELPYENDILHGRTREYFDNGQNKLSGYYLEGKPVGEWIRWNTAGEVVFHMFFNEAGHHSTNLLDEEGEHEHLPKNTKPYIPALFGSECIHHNFIDQQLACSDSALNRHYTSPPIPPETKQNPEWNGNTYTAELLFTINEEGQVTEVEIARSTGYEFLDFLAVNHLENATPWHAARRYGTPVAEERTALITFSFQ